MADPTPEDPTKRGRLIEDTFILLCILSLWPVILGWQGVVYQVILYAALVGPLSYKHQTLPTILHE